MRNTSQYNVVQYNTTFDLNSKHIIEFTDFPQCHQKVKYNLWQSCCIELL